MEQMGPILAQPAGTSGVIPVLGAFITAVDCSGSVKTGASSVAMERPRKSHLASARMRRDVAMTERGVWGKVRSI